MAKNGTNSANIENGIVVSPQDTLADLDRRGSGVVNVHDIKVGIHQMRMMRKFACLLVVLVFVLLGGMCFATYFAVMMAKEMHVRDGHLVDTDGGGVSTFQQLDVLHGVVFAPGRRLVAFNLTATMGTGALTMSNFSFAHTRAQYLGGKADWVVDMPDGTVRTVNIQGMDLWNGWGICGSCDGSVRWRISCSGNVGDCEVSWVTDGERRRQLKAAATQAFLTRAGQTGVDGDGADASVERSLSDKCPGSV